MSDYDFSDAVNPFDQNNYSRPEEVDYDFSDAINPFTDKQSDTTQSKGLSIPDQMKAEADYNERTGDSFFGRLGANAEIAGLNTLNTMDGARLSEYGELLSSYNEKDLESNPELRNEYATTRGNFEKTLKDIGDRQQEIQSLPQRPETQRMLNPEGDVWYEQVGNSIDAFTDDPFGVVGDVTVQNLPGMAASMGMFIAGKGAGLGNKASAGMAGATSGLQESYNNYIKLRQDGLDHDTAWEKSVVNGSVVGLLDAVSFGTAGGTVRRMAGGTIPSKAVATAKETLTQGALGAAGAAGGKYASNQEIEVGEVMGEFVGEAGGAPLTMITTKVDPVSRSRTSVDEGLNELRAEQENVNRQQRTGVITGEDLGLKIPEQQDYSDYDRPAVSRKQNLGPMPQRGRSEILSDIGIARRMGFEEEAQALSQARELYMQADQAKAAGNEGLANELINQANQLHMSAIDTSPRIAETIDNLPVPYVSEGEVQGGGLSIPESQPNFTMPEEPIQGQAREVDPVDNRLTQDNANKLPPGTEQINLGREYTPPESTPIDPTYNGVGENIANRQAPNGLALPNQSSVTQEQVIDQQRVNKPTVAQIDQAAAETNEQPTEAQIEADNYKKGRIKIAGLNIAIENRKGGTRSGTDESGKKWTSTMAHHYGDIKGYKGADGDDIDVFIGDNPESNQVFIVDQIDPKTGAFDEHKVMIGFNSLDEAKAGYLANYEENWQGAGEITAVPEADFKQWLKGDTTKPYRLQPKIAEGLVFRPNGSPYKTENGAKFNQAFRNNKGAKVIKVPNGFAIQLPSKNEATEESITDQPSPAIQPNINQDSEPQQTEVISEPKTPKSEAQDSLPVINEEQLGDNQASAEELDPASSDKNTSDSGKQESKSEPVNKIEDFGEKIDTIEAKETDSGVAIFESSVEYSSDERNPSSLQSEEPSSGELSSQANDDLLSPAEIPSKSAAGQAKDNFNLKYKQVAISEIPVAFDTVNDASEVAHIVSPFRKHGQETMLALVTDKNGKIVNLIRHTKGGKSASSVYPAELVAAIASTPDAANVWFAHNHPSGLKTPSSADYSITEKLAGVLDGSNVEYKGHVIVSGGTKATFFKDGQYDTDKEIKVKAAHRKRKLSVTERVLRKKTLDDAEIVNSPAVASKVAEKIESKDALILLTNQNQVIGSISMTAKEMSELRKNNRVNRIWEAIDSTNAAAFIIKTGDKYAARNLSNFLNKSGDLRILDWLSPNAIGGYDSDQQQGGSVVDSTGVFFSREALNPSSSAGINKVSSPALTVDAVKRATRIIASRLKLRGVKLSVVESEDLLPSSLKAQIAADGAEGEIKAAYHKDSIYIVADRMKSVTDVEEAVLHEAAHFGGRSLFGKDMHNAYRKLWMKIGGVKGLRTRAKEAGFEKELDLYIKTAEDLMAKGEITSADRARFLVDEFLAHLNQQKAHDSIPKRVSRAIKEFMGAIRDMLRKYKLAKLEELSDSDLQYLLKRITQASQDSDSKADKPHFMRVSEQEEMSMIFSDMAEQLGEAEPMFSRAPDPMESGFAIPDETLVSAGLRKMADKFKVLKDLQKNIRATGKEIDEAADAYIAEELFHGKAENDLRQMRETFVEPLAKKMAEFGITQTQLDEYLYAKHAEERNEYIASINPDMQDGGSGMTNTEAQEIINDIELSGKANEYDQLASIVYDMLAARRDEIINGGLEDQGMIDAWQETYENYVPLKGHALDEKHDQMPGTGRGFTIGGRENRRALGRSSEASSPLANTIQDLTGTLIRKRKNEVGNAFLKLAQENPNESYWNVYTDENPDTDRKISHRMTEDSKKARAKAKREGDPIPEAEYTETVTEQAVPMAMMPDKYFTTKKDGKTYYIKLEDPRLMKAMKNIGPDTSSFVIQTLGKISRFLSSVNTSYNPEFVVGNFARDIQTAVLNLSAEQSAEDGKVKGEKIAAKTVKDVPVAMRTIYRSMRGWKKNNTEWANYFEEFQADGAKTGYFDMKDIDGQAKDVQRLIDISKGGFKGGFYKWTKATGKFIEDVNSSVENAVRLSAYVNARKAGISKMKAASLAKNMTVNFNRKGEVGTTLNALYMFANASIQGSMNFARTMGSLKGEQGDPVWQRLNTAQKISIGLMGGSFALAMANRTGAGEDDDGENWYDKIPQYVKERNLVVMKSLLGGEQDGSYWKIPLPYGYNIFHVFGTSAESVTNGNTSVIQGAVDLSLAALGSFSPIGFQDSKDLSTGILKNIAPTIAKPIVDVVANENFMGSSIYNENFPFGTPKPNSSLSRRSTPEIYKLVAEFLNDVSGGSQWRSGSIDINPDAMRYFVDYALGGAGKLALSKVPDNVYRGFNGIELPASRTVFLSRVNGQVLPYEDQSKFYDRRNEIGQIEEEYKALRGSERLKFRRENYKLLRLKPLIKGTERKLKFFRKQRNAIYTTNVSPALKDRRLKVVEQKMKRVIDRFNKEYKKAQN